MLVEVYLLCLIESVSFRDIGQPTSRAEISSPNPLYFEAVKRAHFGSALTGVTSELTNYNRKENSHKTNYSLLRKIHRASSHNFMLFLLIKFIKWGTESQ